MGTHLIDGEFQSDKYPTCPPGKVPLSVTDPTAQDLLWEYAQRRRSVDSEFSADLETALLSAGYGKAGHASDPCLLVWASGADSDGDFIVAESAGEASRLYFEFSGIDVPEREWEALPGPKPLTITAEATTKTCAEWAQENGKGYLATFGS